MLRLDQLEATIQKLVEDQLTGILPGMKLEDRVIQHLTTAVKENIVLQKDDRVIAPIHLHDRLEGNCPNVAGTTHA
jgi:hypothetical protein